VSVIGCDPSEESVAKPLHNSLSFDSSMFSQKREMEWYRDDLHVDEVQEPDYFFRCNYCVKLIADDETVHMLKDRSYCSTTCRAKGRSALYRRLRDAQSNRSQKSTDSTLSCSDGAASVVCASHSDGALHRATEKNGPLSWVLGRMLTAIMARVPAAEMVRSASNALDNHLNYPSPVNRMMMGALPGGRVASFISSVTEEPSWDTISN